MILLLLLTLVKSGYAKTITEEDKCQDNIQDPEYENCKKCSEDGSECIECFSDDYVPYGTYCFYKCKKGIYDCQECSEDGKECIKCPSDDYTPTGPFCYCNAGYESVNGQCVKELEIKLFQIPETKPLPDSCSNTVENVLTIDTSKHENPVRKEVYKQTLDNEARTVNIINQNKLNIILEISTPQDIALIPETDDTVLTVLDHNFYTHLYVDNVNHTEFIVNVSETQTLAINPVKDKADSVNDIYIGKIILYNNVDNFYKTTHIESSKNLIINELQTFGRTSINNGNKSNTITIKNVKVEQRGYADLSNNDNTIKVEKVEVGVRSSLTFCDAIQDSDLVIYYNRLSSSTYPLSVSYSNFNILPKSFTIKEKKANTLLEEEAIINESTDFMISYYSPWKESEINNEYCEKLLSKFVPSDLFVSAYCKIGYNTKNSFALFARKINNDDDTNSINTISGKVTFDKENIDDFVNEVKKKFSEEDKENVKNVLHVTLPENVDTYEFRNLDLSTNHYLKLDDGSKINLNGGNLNVIFENNSKPTTINIGENNNNVNMSIINLEENTLEINSLSTGEEKQDIFIKSDSILENLLKVKSGQNVKSITFDSIILSKNGKIQNDNNDNNEAKIKVNSISIESKSEAEIKNIEINSNLNITQTSHLILSNTKIEKSAMNIFLSSFDVADYNKNPIITGDFIDETAQINLVGLNEENVKENTDYLLIEGTFTDCNNWTKKISFGNTKFTDCYCSEANSLSAENEKKKEFLFVKRVQNQSDKGKKLSGGAIAGIVIGCVAAVAIIVVVVVVVIKKKTGVQNSSES